MVEHQLPKLRVAGSNPVFRSKPSFMQKVVALGETVLDILFRGNEPMAATAGGAMLNTSVSLGRMKLPVFLVSEIGNDIPGKIIKDFLKDNGVNTTFLKVYESGQTPVAIALLDKEGNAKYSFYKNYPEKRFLLHAPQFLEGDFLIFGSFYSLTPGIREDIITFLEKARENMATIIYDPNIRKNHAHQVSSLRYEIMENFRFANIIRASTEDLLNIFGDEELDKIVEMTGRTKVFIITQGSGEVIVYCSRNRYQFPVKNIKAISTVGAGDTFNAGLIYSLYRRNISPGNLLLLNKQEWESVIEMASRFAANACLGFENYISKEFAENIQ